MKIKMFEIIKKNKKSSQRSGLLTTRNGVVKTPVFMPIATKGAVKSLTSEDLKNLGAQIILGNTYHLWLRPGTEIIKKAGNLHGFMNWPGPILTDSGGYQVFSLGEKIKHDFKLQNIISTPTVSPSLGEGERKRGWGEENQDTASPDPSSVKERGSHGALHSTEEERKNANFVKISDEGVEFKDPTDGKKYFLTPEKSIDIQLALGSDIITVLDECPAFPCTYEKAKAAVERTTRWAKRCKDYFERKGISKSQFSIFKQIQNSKSKNQKRINRPLIFGVVQGGVYKDLREKSTKELLAIGFDGYAIGGVAVGEPRKFLKTVLDAALPLLPQDKPRYLMGLGKPEEIVAAVNSGIDMFDCVIPTREARHGKLYKFSIFNFQFSKKKFYETLQITNSKFAKDFSSIDKNCSCYTCQNYSRAYLHHLFKVGEPLSLRLATIHNLRFYLGLMESLRK